MEKINLLGADHRPGKRSDEIYICCMFCVTRVGKVDKDFKMGVNLRNGLYHCYRCGASPSTTGSIRDINELKMLAGMEVSPQLDKLKTRISNLFQVKKSNIFDLDYVTNEISPQNTPFSLKYLKDRGITEEEIKKYNIRVGKEYKTTMSDGSEKTIYRWAGRVVFPFTENGEVTFLVGRTIRDEEPRYINSDGNKNTAVYGYDFIKDGQCIICEGILSSMAAARTTGISAVAVLGKYATDFQIEKIRSKCEKVWISLDGDVEDQDREKIKKQLLKTNMKIYEVILPKDKDPDDLGSDYIKYFKEAKKISIW